MAADNRGTSLADPARKYAPWLRGRAQLQAALGESSPLTERWLATDSTFVGGRAIRYEQALRLAEALARCPRINAPRWSRSICARYLFPRSVGLWTSSRSRRQLTLSRAEGASRRVDR